MSGPTQTGIPADAIEAGAQAIWQVMFFEADRHRAVAPKYRDAARAALAAAQPFLTADAQEQIVEAVEEAIAKFQVPYGVFDTNSTFAKLLDVIYTAMHNARQEPTP